MSEFKFNVTDKKVLSLPSNIQIVFLCGVQFRGGKKFMDKRLALQEIIRLRPNTSTVILEEHFANLEMYNDIGIRNIHDVENLVSYFSNATIVIHESLSTAAEIGMLASSQTSADRTIVLYPDSGIIKNEKVRGFINFAYYNANPVLPKTGRIPFVPRLRDIYESNYAQTTHTFLPTEFDASYPYSKVQSFLDSSTIKSVINFTFRQLNYKQGIDNSNDIIDYDYTDEVLTVFISTEALKATVISLLSVDQVRIEVNRCTKYIDVISVIYNQLEAALSETIQDYLPTTPKSTSIELKNIQLTQTQKGESITVIRKALGMFVYLLKAVGFLYIEDDAKFKVTRGFASTRESFLDSTVKTRESSFAKAESRNVR
jgi:uncharacterized alkaline shock family protein YloU